MSERLSMGGFLYENIPLPPGQDDDIPDHVKRELMTVAKDNGRISYFYLCDLWRRGHASAIGTILEQVRKDQQ